MRTFFSRVIKNASQDTTRAFAGTAVSITLGMAGEYVYDKIKHPSLPQISSPPFETMENNEATPSMLTDGKRK